MVPLGEYLPITSVNLDLFSNVEKMVVCAIMLFFPLKRCVSRFLFLNLVNVFSHKGLVWQRLFI